MRSLPRGVVGTRVASSSPCTEAGHERTPSAGSPARGRSGRRRLPGVLALALLVLGVGPLGAQSLPRVDIGIVSDGPSPITDRLAERTRLEIETLLQGEFEPVFGDRHARAGSWTLDSVRREVRALEDDPEVDVILALGVLASHLFCCEEVLAKPVIAPLVLDAVVQGLPRDGETSGRHNLNYLAIPSSARGDLEALHEIVPFERVTFVGNRWLFEAVPGLGHTLQDLVVEIDLDDRIELLPVGDSVDEALAALSPETDAVLLAPLLHLGQDERQRFLDGVNARDLPSFSIMGLDELEMGALASRRSSSLYQRLARRIALHVQRILLGEDAADLPTTFTDRTELRINLRTAREIGVDPPWELLTVAELLHEEDEDLPVVTLADALNDALFRNLGLAAEERAVDEGAEVVRRARAALRPRLESSANGVRIDDDRASALTGRAETTWSAGLELRQLLWSEAARANVDVQRSLQEGRGHALRGVRLDVVRDVAVAYYNLLRAQTLRTIRREDLQLTRSNLQLAEVRTDLGQAGPGEVYRWEAELANARQAVVAAGAAVRKAQIALNRVRHRPLGKEFRTEADGLTLEYLLERRGRLLAFTGSRRDFELTTDFMVAEAMRRVPELRELESAIGAQERAVAAARRAFWSPDVALLFSWDERLGTSGVGSDTGSAGLPFGLTSPDDSSWSAALSATLPLFEGGARSAELAEAEVALERLRLEREGLAELLEQAIRSNLQDTRVAFSSIVLTRDAAATARKSLDLVTDAYRQGAADLLDLLDAQTTALSADLAAADAQFEFFVELVETERSAGYYFDYLSPEEQDDWYGRLEERFREAGRKVWKDRDIRLGGGRVWEPSAADRKLVE